MDNQPEKIYVAVGNDSTDGYVTLEWAIKKFSSQTISIVILHLNVNASSMDLVHTPFGKLPSSSVNDEKLEGLRMCEQKKIDKLLLKYTAFCGKVRTETLKIEKSEEPIQNIILGLISQLQITKLVMGITVMKSSSCKAKSAISGCFYIHKHKPDFCELFIICGGKLVSLREDNEEGIGSTKDDKVKKNLGNYKPDERSNLHRTRPGPSNTGSQEPVESGHSRWEKYYEEIENYILWLKTSTLTEEEEEDGALSLSPLQLANMEIMGNESVKDKIETLKAQIEEAQATVEQNRREAKANIERQAKAEWVISVCDQRAQDLQSHINEEIALQMDLKKALDTAKDHLYEVTSDIREGKSRLNSILELQSEFSEKLQSSNSTKFHVESQLEKAMTERTHILKEIEDLRRHRDVLQRRIEFCRERDAIATATGSSNLDYRYRQFTIHEIMVATDNFSEKMRLKSGGEWSNVYRGVLNHTTVAIKLQRSVGQQSQEDFQTQMEFLCRIHHPHLITVIGACPEIKCVVLEYMQNGGLQDILLSSHTNPRRRNQVLSWPARIRIATEICSGLAYLHSAQPRPIIHGNLKTSNILLDRNLVAKMTGFQHDRCSDVSDMCLDIGNFGVLMLQLLTGRDGPGLVEEVKTATEGRRLVSVLDEEGRYWPLDLVTEFVEVAMGCIGFRESIGTELKMATVMQKLEEIMNKAEVAVAAAVAAAAARGAYSEVVEEEECNNIPRTFLCPILKDVMKNPHVAADGFSYELEAIEEWLGTGHETSPMTNLRLKHKRLTPNHTLRSLIQDWLNNKTTSPSLQ